MKGKPWTVEEEKQLRHLVEEKAPIRAMTEAMDKKIDCVRKKIERLGLAVVAQGDNQSRTTTSNFALPEELPSIEEALRIFAGAMEALRKPGLDKEKWSIENNRATVSEDASQPNKWFTKKELL